ncbi:MAG TPA: hypothetical protein VJJ22_03300 [Candidatus Paceibacterota bacterium]
MRMPPTKFERFCVNVLRGAVAVAVVLLCGLVLPAVGKHTPILSPVGLLVVGASLALVISAGAILCWLAPVGREGGYRRGFEITTYPQLILVSGGWIFSMIWISNMWSVITNNGPGPWSIGIFIGLVAFTGYLFYLLALAPIRTKRG